MAYSNGKCILCTVSTFAVFGILLASPISDAESLAENVINSDGNDTEIGVRTAAGIYSYRHLGSLTKKILLPNGADINTWVPRFNLSKAFIMYHCGNDLDGRPFGVVELGKWDFKRVIEAGHLQEFEYYGYQLIHRIVQITQERAVLTNQTPSGVGIIDLKDLQLAQVTYIPAMKFLTNLAREYRWILAQYLEEAIFLNMAFAAEIFVNLMRPLVGNVFERVTLFGSDPAKYIPKLLHRFPRENLPPWYGGTKDFKPIEVFG